MLPEEALPPDGADSWVMSSYLLRRCARMLAAREAALMYSRRAEHCLECFLCLHAQQLAAELGARGAPPCPPCRPHTLAKKRAGWEAPWLCEAKGGAAAAVDELEDDDMHWSMDLVGVRCAEKMLDVLAGMLEA